jgi:hypothetical protein
VIDDEDEDDDGLMSSAFDIFKLQRICKYLSHVLIHCINHYHNNNMTEITKIVIDEINEHEAYNIEGYDEVGVSNARFTISRGNTLMKYYNNFNHTGYFSNPARPSKTKSGLPPILEENPEFKESIKRFCMSNLQTLTSESAHLYICNLAV